MCGKIHRQNISSAVCVSFILVTHNHFMALFPGPPRWAGARRHFLMDFYGARDHDRGRHTDRHPDGQHSIQTNQWPNSIIPPIFMPDALPAATLSLHPGFWQAPNTNTC